MLAQPPRSFDDEAFFRDGECLQRSAFYPSIHRSLSTALVPLQYSKHTSSLSMSISASSSTHPNPPTQPNIHRRCVTKSTSPAPAPTAVRPNGPSGRSASTGQPPNKRMAKPANPPVHWNTKTKTMRSPQADSNPSAIQRNAATQPWRCCKGSGIGFIVRRRNGLRRRSLMRAGRSMRSVIG